MSVTSLVKELIETSGMSKAALARVSGVSRSSLDDYIHGKRQPSVAQLERLGASAGLKLDLAWAPADVRQQPAWLKPDNPAMADRATTTAQRAALLERVIPLGRELRRRPPSPVLEFPPFRTIGA